jgi:hypothetical protein
MIRMVERYLGDSRYRNRTGNAGREFAWPAACRQHVEAYADFISP